MRHKIGLAVMRLQPLHFGHTGIINRMIIDCQTAIIGLGSAQKYREKHDPWMVDERITMIRNVYGDRVRIVPLNDLGASRPEEWVSYIFEKLSKLGMREPTDYFTGSEQDSFWYKDHFSYDNISYDEALPTQYNQRGLLRQLHLLDRNNNPVPSATEIRGMLELRTDAWKNWVPYVNHELVFTTYPEDFKIPLAEDGDEIPFD